MSASGKHSPQGHDRQKAVDTGMAITLICIIAGLVGSKSQWFAAAAAVLVVNMTVPKLFGPAAKLWFGLSSFLGGIMSRVILTLVFYLVLTPVGLLRRAMGSDRLHLAAFKKDTSSVFVAREGQVSAADLKYPF